MGVSGRILFWLLLSASFLSGNADDKSRIRGIPGKDYPNYSSIPHTSFRCSEQLHIPGFYADTETRCQVFHHCYEHRQESFLCPLGTVFNQAILACDYWYSADCSAAPLYYDSNSHQTIIYDTEPGFAPIKTSRDNLLDKMASLYEFNDDFPSPNDSGNNADSLDDNHTFRDRELIVQSKFTIKNRNFKEGADDYDRHDIVQYALPKVYEYAQNNEDFEDNVQNLENSFEGSGEFSGESKELEGEALYQGGYLWPSNGKDYFDDQQFSIMQEEYVEEKTKPHDSTYYKDESMDSVTHFPHVLDSFSKESSISGDELIKRYSENHPPYSKKSVRRKPLFTISESHSEIATTELSKDKVSTSSIDPFNEDTTSAPLESMFASNFPDLSMTHNKAKRKRKPIVIDLDDSLQYSIDSARKPEGGASVNYEVDPQSEMPGVSIAAQEISVKLIPSNLKRKRKPVGEYLFNHYTSENDEPTESSTISYLTSPISNMHYEAATFPTLNEFKILDEDIVMNIDRVNPIRKKNKIRIIDSDDNHVDVDDGKQIQFEDETLSQPTEEEFQNFEDNISNDFEETEEISEHEPDVSLKEDDVETDPSYFITEHEAVTLTNIVPHTHDSLQETHSGGPDMLFKTSEGLDYSYTPHINHESSSETEHFVGDSDLDDKADSVILKSVDGFDLTTHDEMQDETYFTTEPMSEISTSMPLEIQNKEESASQFYLIPQSNFESGYDYFRISKNTWGPVTAAGGDIHARELLESESFDLQPPYHIFMEDSIRDETAKLPHSEDVELQTLISDSYESDKQMEYSHTTESPEKIYYHKNGTSISSESQNITATNYANSEKEYKASDLLLVTELQDHIPNSNLNLDSKVKVDNNLIEIKQTGDPALKDETTKYSSEIQLHLIDETVDFDAMGKREKGTKDQTILLELNTNSPHFHEMVNTEILERIELENVEHKGNAESEDFQGVVNLSNDFSDASNQLDPAPLIINPILKTYENPPFRSPINAFSNNAASYKQKLKSKSVVMEPDLSKVIDNNQVKPNEKHGVHPTLLPTDKGSTKNTKTRPLRSTRALTSPNQMDFNLGAFGSQYFPGFPSAVLKLKQSSIQKLLPYSGHGLDDGIFNARTGSLLESPKISKLISFGKNLLRSKKAKYRILSRYVNSFKSNQ